MKLNRNLLTALKDMADAHPLRMRVSGDSMAPTLYDGAQIEITPARFYWPGDVIAFQDRQGQLIVHRLLGYRPRRRGIFSTRFTLIAQGDARLGCDGPIELESVIGRTGKPSISGRLLALSRFSRLITRFLTARIPRYRTDISKAGI